MSQQISEELKNRRYELWKRGFVPKHRLGPEEQTQFPLMLKAERTKSE